MVLSAGLWALAGCATPAARTTPPEAIDLRLCLVQGTWAPELSEVNRNLIEAMLERYRRERLPPFASLAPVASVEEAEGCDLVATLSSGGFTAFSPHRAETVSARSKRTLYTAQTRGTYATAANSIGDELGEMFSKGTPLYNELAAEKARLPSRSSGNE